MNDPSHPVTRQAIAAQDRALPGKVTGRLKRAIIEMVWSGARRADAAHTAGMTDHSLRAALKKPHVIRYYRSELDVLRESERARNVSALVDVRDGSSNAMARVNAARALEDLAVTSDPAAPMRSLAPGITIILGDRSIQRDPQLRLTRIRP